MSVQAQLSSLANLVRRSSHRSLSERDTERILVEPFISALGYNPRDPDEVRTQQEIQIGSTTTRCDYAILCGQEIRVLMECKRSSVSLGTPGQLSSYFSQTPAALLGVFTNGLEYRFYGEKIADGVKRMDDEPFAIIDLRNLDEKSITIARRCAKHELGDAGRFREWVSELRYESIIEAKMRHELAVEPSDGLVRLVMDWVGATEKTAERIDHFRDIVKDIGCRIVDHEPPVGTSAEALREKETPVDSAPHSGEWISLDRDFPTTGSPSPSEMKLPDGKASPIVSWTDVPKEIAIWLYERSILTQENCQLDVGRTRYLLSHDGKHRNGKVFHNRVDVGETGVQMEGSFNPDKLVLHAIKLLRNFQEDPSRVCLKLG